MIQKKIFSSDKSTHRGKYIDLGFSHSIHLQLNIKPAMKPSVQFKWPHKYIKLPNTGISNTNNMNC